MATPSGSTSEQTPTQTNMATNVGASGFKISFPTLLKRESYPSWARGMEFGLRSLNLWSIIDAPEENQVSESTHYQVMSILHNAVAPHMQVRVDMCKSAKEAWQEIKHNCQGAAERYQDMMRVELANLKKGPNETVEMYFARALQIRNNLASAGVDYNDKQLLFHVLNGLPADYEPVRASLAYQKGVTLIDAQADLTDFEARQNSLHQKTEVGLYAKNYPNGAFRGKCHNCHERGHMKHQCKKPPPTPSARNAENEKDEKAESAGLVAVVKQLVQAELAKPRARDVSEIAF
jgi:hypothetical protein